MQQKRGQIGTEYLIIISFVTLAVITTLGIALVYTANIQDSIRINQLERAGKKIIFAAESTYYDGEGALATVEVLFPEGITDFRIEANEIVFSISTGSGINVISYPSNVPLSEDPSIIPNPAGIRRVQIRATADDSQISLL